MGRPKGSKNRTAATRRRNTQVRKIAVQGQEEPNLLVCCTCGRHYDKYNTNFPKAQSEIWAARDHYLPICKNCLDDLYEHYLDVYGGDDRKAIRRICMGFDIYYSDRILDACTSTKKSQSLIHAYISRSNLVQYKKNRDLVTYDTTLDEERDERAEAIEEALEDAETEKVKTRVTAEAYQRWGTGAFEINEYRILEDHYQMLHKNNPNIDNNQEIFVKTLCQLNLMMTQAMRDKDYDTYAKINDQYSKTFTKAGLKTVEEKDASNEATLGVTLGVISQYTPEEFYKDKDLYKDYDKLGEYFNRFVKRPMENLMTGSNIRDEEFFVPDEDEDDG